MRDAPLRPAAAAEIAQHDVRVQIPDFTDEVECECGIGDVGVGWPRGRSGRAVGPECDVRAGQEPVMGRVFENVQQGHGGGRESVDEDGFELAFDKVQDYKCEGERLELGGTGGRWQKGE